MTARTGRATVHLTLTAPTLGEAVGAAQRILATIDPTGTWTVDYRGEVETVTLRTGDTIWSDALAERQGHVEWSIEARHTADRPPRPGEPTMNLLEGDTTVPSDPPRPSDPGGGEWPASPWLSGQPDGTWWDWLHRRSPRR